MVLLGTIVNVIAIVIGTTIGMFFTKINEKIKETILQGISLTVIIIGIQMAFSTESIIVVLLSLLFGAIIGELLKLEDLLNRLGNWIGDKLNREGESNRIAQGFVTASLIFVIGAMAIIGSLDSGIRHDHGVLYTKSILDGFTSMVLATTLGFGVVLSAIPVFLYQGTIAILAAKIDAIIPKAILDQVVNEMTAVGGILIFAIGLNMIGLTKIRVTNLLPALFIVIIFVFILQLF